MSFKDRPEAVAQSEQYDTIPDSSVLLNAQDNLAGTTVGSLNLTGKHIWLHALAAIRVIRGGSGAVGAGVGLPMASGEKLRFFVDPTTSTVIRHSGSDGQLVALYDSEG